MKTTKFIVLSMAVILLSAFTITNSVSWKIVEGHSVKFTGKDAEGIFKELKGNIQFDAEKPESSSFAFTIPVSSINTGNGMKNKHAVGKRWFNADTYPNITFKSSSLAKEGNNYKVTGIMNIHGTDKEMTIPFTFDGKEFKSNFSVKRMDFGVGTMKGMSKKVSDEIKLDVIIPVTK